MKFRTRTHGTRRQVGRHFPVGGKSKLPPKIKLRRSPSLKQGRSEAKGLSEAKSRSEAKGLGEYRAAVMKDIMRYKEDFMWLDEKTLDTNVLIDVDHYIKMAKAAKTKNELDFISSEMGHVKGPTAIHDYKADGARKRRRLERILKAGRALPEEMRKPEIVEILAEELPEYIRKSRWTQRWRASEIRKERPGSAFTKHLEKYRRRFLQDNQGRDK